MKYFIVFIVPLFINIPLLNGFSKTDSLLSILDKSTMKVEKGTVCIQIAKEYQTNNLQKTHDYAQEALSYIFDVDSLKVEAWNLLGRYFFYTNQLDSALFYFNEVKGVYKVNGEINKVARINISIGSALMRKPEYEKAVETFIESATFFESIEDDGNAAKCYSNLSAAFAELNDLPTAISYGEKAIVVFRSEKMINYELIALPNLATQYMRSGDQIKALELYKQGEQLALSNNNKRSLTLIYNNLGDLYLTDSQLILAEEYTQKALELKIEMNLRGKDASFYNLGAIEYKKGRYSRALSYYKKAIETAKDFNKLKTYEGLKETYNKLGGIKNAYKYAESYQLLSDSLEREKSHLEISKLTSQYEATKRENEILVLKSDNQALEIHKGRSRLISWGLGGLLLLTGVFSFMASINAKRKRIIAKQVHELEEQKLNDALGRQELLAVENLIEGQEEERKRIARDLHDSLGSKLSTLKRYIEGLFETQGVEKDTLESAMNLADQSYKEVRNIAHNLNAGALMEAGLIPALRKMVKNVSSLNDIKISLNAPLLKLRLQNHVEIQLFRIIQELLSNVIKHAHASEVIVQLTSHDDSLNVIIEDNGRGFKVSDVKLGMGLKNLKKRIDQINGDYHIDSSVQSGTTTILNIPI